MTPRFENFWCLLFGRKTRCFRATQLHAQVHSVLFFSVYNVFLSGSHIYSLPPNLFAMQEICILPGYLQNEDDPRKYERVKIKVKHIHHANGKMRQHGSLRDTEINSWGMIAFFRSNKCTFLKFHLLTFDMNAQV